MKGALALCAALTLTACGARVDDIASATLPDGVSVTDVAQFKVAVTSAGCAIGPTEAATVTAQTGFSRDKLVLITQYLTLAGESVPTDNGFRLISGSCSNA